MYFMYLNTYYMLVKLRLHKHIDAHQNLFKLIFMCSLIFGDFLDLMKKTGVNLKFVLLNESIT